MATYIANLTDHITPIELFRPDWQFFQSTLQNLNYKQKLYENSLNNSFYYIAEANITNEENKNLRNEFLANYKEKIEKLAQKDLTKSENIAYARSLFTPILENDSYLHDLNFTKISYDNIKKANESLSNYNEDSKLAIQYRLQEYANAPLEKRLSMKPMNYIPKVNEIELITDYFKKYEPSVQTVSVSNDGKYIITYKNGKQAEAEISNYIYHIISSDSRIIEAEKQKAYVTRMSYINTYGYDKGYEMYSNLINEKVNILRNETNKLTNIINNYNRKMSETEDAINETQRTITMINGFSLNDNEFAKNITTNMDALIKRRDFLLKNIQSALDISKQNSQLLDIFDKKRIMDSQLYDNIFAQANIVNRVSKYGLTFSSIKSEVDIKENKIYLQMMQNENAKEVARIYASAYANKNNSGSNYNSIMRVDFGSANGDANMRLYKGPGKNEHFVNIVNSHKFKELGTLKYDSNNKKILPLTNNIDIRQKFIENVPSAEDNKNKINYAVLKVRDTSPSKYKYYLLKGEYGQQSNTEIPEMNANKPSLNNIYYTEINEDEYNDIIKI